MIWPTGFISLCSGCSPDSVQLENPTRGPNAGSLLMRRRSHFCFLTCRTRLRSSLSEARYCTSNIKCLKNFLLEMEDIQHKKIIKMEDINRVLHDVTMQYQDGVKFGWWTGSENWSIQKKFYSSVLLWYIPLKKYRKKWKQNMFVFYLAIKLYYRLLFWKVFPNAGTIILCDVALKKIK